MADPSPTIEDDARAFCDTCQWAYECWVTHANLFDDLLQDSGISYQDFMDTPYGRCLDRLHKISCEYSILQIMKLHDSSKRSQNENLSVAYFVAQDVWSEEEKSKVEQIVIRLEKFIDHVRPARNKIIAHNDRSIAVNNTVLGKFPSGMDERYFRALGELVSLIWEKWLKTSNPLTNRVFKFTKSGLDNDALCPSNDAKELREYIAYTIASGYKNTGDL